MSLMDACVVYSCGRERRARKPRFRRRIRRQFEFVSHLTLVTNLPFATDQAVC